jgi:HPt (histidine-containing phosphotransfer) domain-containing protein
VKQLNAYLQKYIRDKYPEEAEIARSSAKFIAVPENEISAELTKHFIRDAKNAANVLESLISNKNLNPDEIKQYTITVHGMKSALANVNIDELSKTASTLEEAGRANDAEKIIAQTSRFIADLQEIIAAFELRLNSESEKREDFDDPALLKEQLELLISACENYSKPAE